MPATRFVDRLNEQIAYEFAASQQYIAVAVHYDAQSLPRLASLFYKQAVEERNHALMMVKYLLDRDAAVKIPGVDEPRNDFGDVTEAIALSLEQEKRVGDAIEALAQTARDEKDYYSEQFMFWFLKEQVEEVAKMSTLLQVAERERNNPSRIEDFIVREAFDADAADQSAPEAAGGAL
ncbi:MAG: bacterioferritin [Frankiaceae bacterium]|nr:bacterioferritin [Frankiaceae bacterium]